MRLLGFEILRAKAALTSAPPNLPLHNVDGWGRWSTIFETRPFDFQRDIHVDHETVKANWAVFACMTLIAGDVGKMPIRLMQSTDGIWTERPDKNVGPLLAKPNEYQVRAKFFESWMFSKLGRGNTYVLKERDARGVVRALHVLDPHRVTPLVAPDGSVYYQLHDDELSGVPEGLPAVPASEIIHDRMWCLFHPLVGISPLYACGLAATQGLKIQQNSAKFFQNMSRPSGVLTAPGQISDDTAARIKTLWETNFAGDNLGRVAVLGDDLKYMAMAVNADDAQLVEQLKMTSEMVCSAFHVPPYKVGIGPTPTYQNAEVLNQIYYSDCLQTQLEAIEALLDDGLNLAAGSGTEFDIDALLRMDTAAQVKSLNDAVGGGWMSPDEARRRRNLAPVAGGGTPYMQQQNYSLAALGKRDSGDDPFGKAAAPASAPAAPAPADDGEGEDTPAKLLDAIRTKFETAAPLFA